MSVLATIGTFLKDVRSFIAVLKSIPKSFYKKSFRFFSENNPKVLYASYKKRKSLAVERELTSDTVFFDYRFRAAFPGCREVEEFSGADAMHRLEVLLKKPISAPFKAPLYWFRGTSCCSIEAYKRLNKREFLLDIYHYKMKKLVAIPSNTYYRHLVYVETEAMPPTGLEPLAKEYEEYGEYGLFRKKFVTREEYDDGGTVIKGRVKNLLGKCNLRARYLVDYNFIIAPHSSPINSREVEDEVEGILDGILQGRNTVNDLAALVHRLRKSHLDR